MKLVLWIAAPIVVLIAAAAAIGAALPVKHRATRRARFQTTPAALYAIIDAQTDKSAYEIVEARAPERYLTRIADKSLPYGGTWTYDIAPAGPDAADLRITEDGEVYNPIFRFVSRFLMGHHATIEKYLKDLGRKLNQPVQIEE
jgi:hypothetical protein